jgi:ABC-2 type transport system permease protein
VSSTTLTTPVVPRTLASRLRWIIADSGAITRRDLLHWRLQPGAIVAALLFPVFMVLIFGYLFGGAISVPGGGNYREFLLPGMFAMTMLLGVGKTMISINTDVSKGITDRFRSMPMALSALPIGRTVADLLDSAVALAVMTGCGLAVGWRVHDGITRALAAVGLLLLLRFALVWVGIYVGLVIKGAEAVNTVYTLEFPLGFLSSAFVAPATMPGWLGAVAEWNPLSSTVAATRQLFGNPGFGGDSWVTHHAVLMAVVWPAVISAVFMVLSARTYRWLSH